MGRMRVRSCSGALSFATSTSSILLGTNPVTGSPAFTICMWLKKARVQAGSTPHLFWFGSVANGLFRAYKSAGTWVFAVHGVDSVVVNDSVFPPGEWVRLVVTRSAGAAGVTRVYVNGSKVAEGAACALTLVAGDPAYFAYIGSNGLQGRLWDFRFLDVEWSQQRVEQDWLGQEDGDVGLLRGLWCDNLTDGTTVERVQPANCTVTGGTLDTSDVPFRARSVV